MADDVVLALEPRDRLRELVVVRDELDELRLEREPVALQLLALDALLRDLPLEVVDGGLEGPRVLVLHVGSELLVLAVQQVDLLGALLDLVVPAADLELILLDGLELVLHLLVEQLEGLLELLVVGVGVEAVDLELGHLVLQRREVDLLLADLLAERHRVLGRLLRRLLGRRLLAQLREHLVLELLDLVGRLVDRLVDAVLLAAQDLLLHLGAAQLLLRLLRRLLQLCVGVLEALLLLAQRRDVLHEELALALDLPEHGRQLLVLQLLLDDIAAEPLRFVVDV